MRRNMITIKITTILTVTIVTITTINRTPFAFSPERGRGREHPWVKDETR